MILNQLEIPEEAVKEFCGRHKVSELSLFGSFVSGGAQASSDLDILLQFKPDAHIGFVEMSQMRGELSRIFGKEVDLVPKSGLKEVIRAGVLSSALVIYAE